MKTLSVNVLFILAMLLTSCSKKDDPTQQEIVRGMLTSGTWKIQTVTIGGEDALDFFPGLQVNFTETGFTATNGGPVWPSSGSWNFSNEEATHILRGDGIDITIISITDSQFECSLHWNETIIDDGRIGALEGDHKFVFIK